MNTFVVFKCAMFWISACDEDASIREESSDSEGDGTEEEEESGSEEETDVGTEEEDSDDDDEPEPEPPKRGVKRSRSASKPVVDAVDAKKVGI